MPETQWHPLYGVIANAVIAVAISWITVKLSIRKFHSEKWFERRLDAYTRVIDALHKMRVVTEREMNSERRAIEISDAVREELTDSYNASKAELRRLTDLGALVFSPAAVAELERILLDVEAADPENGWWEYYESQNSAVTRGLSQLRKRAKEELHA